LVFAKGMQNYTLFSFNQIFGLNKLIKTITVDYFKINSLSNIIYFHIIC